jgi:hypothetical protein
MAALSDALERNEAHHASLTKLSLSNNKLDHDVLILFFFSNFSAMRVNEYSYYFSFLCFFAELVQFRTSITKVDGTEGTQFEWNGRQLQMGTDFLGSEEE